MAEDADKEAAQRKLLGEAFADGLEIYESRVAEAAAKAAAAGGGKTDDTSTGDDKDGSKSKPGFLDRLLGG